MSQKLLDIIKYVFFVIILVISIRFFDVKYPESYEINFNSYLLQPDDITCGPTSACMLLNYFGKKVSISEVEKQTRTKWFGKIGMTSPDYIEIALNYYGVRSSYRQGDIEHLKYYISKGRPCVCLIRSGEFTWHYILVIGYGTNKIIVADPGSGNRLEIKLNNFISSWRFVSDMEGNRCKNILKDILKEGEIYPYTLIVPHKI